MTKTEMQNMFQRLNGGRASNSPFTKSDAMLPEPLGAVQPLAGVKLPGTNPTAGSPPTFPQFGQSALSPSNIFKLEH